VVQAGKLLLQGGITASSVVTVAPTTAVTATLASAAGSGYYNISPSSTSGNAVIIGGGISGSTARLAPGDLGSIGSIDFDLAGTAKLAFASHSELDFDISGTTSDLVSFWVGGQKPVGDFLTGSGNAVLSLSGLTSNDYGNTYTVFHNVTTPGFTFASITGYDTANYLAVFGQSGNDYTLSFVALPEPSAFGSAILGAGLMMSCRRFRRPGRHVGSR
jgi:hypothetical protein